MQEVRPFDLSGKTALITGASKGIGAAIAQLYAQYGATIVISSRKQGDLDALAATIAAAGGRCVAIAANTGDPAQVARLVEQTVDQLGGIDILVNNAATNPVYGPLTDCSGEAFDKIMQINVKAPFELGKLVFPIMQQRGGGSVINISSIAALTPDPGLGMYSVSKAALNMLTKVMAKEWGRAGIRVNAICPGLIKTKFSQALWENEALLQRFVKNIPIPRIGAVEEIAPLALYLASDASSYTTGSIFTVDGGTTI